MNNTNKFKSANLKPLALSVIVSLFMSACAYTPTKTAQMPESWNTGKPEVIIGQFNKNDNWWMAFNNAQLNSFMQDVLNKNIDLQQSFIRIKQAQAQVGLVQNSFLPKFNSSLSANVSRAENTPTNKSQSFNIGAQYEVDLWGKIAAQVQAKDLLSRASEEDLSALKISLASQAVNLFYNQAYLNAAINYTLQSSKYYEQLNTILKARFDNGVISNLEVMESQKSLTLQKNTLIGLQRQSEENINAMTLLLGISNSNDYIFDNGSNLSATSFNPIYESIPFDVLQLRPDVKASQARLGSALINIDTTRLSYYPGLSLTGSLGFASTQLVNLLANPVLALGAGLTFPFLNAAERQINISVSKNDYELQVLELKKVFYTALVETKNALFAFEAQKKILSNLEEVAGLNQNIIRANQVKYDVGVIGFKELLDSQEAQRQQDLNLIRSRYDLIVSQSNIYKALGAEYVPKL